MVVGARRPVAGAGGDVAGPGPGQRPDPLGVSPPDRPGQPATCSPAIAPSAPAILTQVHLQFDGFEIETELASEAVTRGLRVVEVSVPYRPRIAGTVSKLKAFRDGRRILMMILRQSVRLRPWRPLGVVGVGLLAVSFLVGSTPLLLVAGTILVAAVRPGGVVAGS